MQTPEQLTGTRERISRISSSESSSGPPLLEEYTLQYQPAIIRGQTYKSPKFALKTLEEFRRFIRLSPNYRRLVANWEPGGRTTMNAGRTRRDFLHLTRPGMAAR